MSRFGFKLAFIVAANLLLGSCATTQAINEVYRIADLARDASNELKKCRASMEGNPKYARLYSKIIIGGKTPTPEQLSDQGVATDEEIALGFDWYAEEQRCSTNSLDTFGKIDPELALLKAKEIRETTNLVMELVTSRPTYGYVNQKIVELRENGNPEIKDWLRRLYARLEARHQQEIYDRDVTKQQFISEVGYVTKSIAELVIGAVLVLAQAQASLAREQASYASTHPTYIPTNKITTTNCRWTGLGINEWNCTSF